jgi:hypothetical protein
MIFERETSFKRKNKLISIVGPKKRKNKLISIVGPKGIEKSNCVVVFWLD